MAAHEISTNPGDDKVQARILIVTAGLSGLLYSSVELALRLADTGHEITYLGPEKARDIVEHHGLRFSELKPSRYEEFLERDAESSRIDRLLRLPRRRAEAVESLELSAFVETVRQLHPDLLLIDGEMHEQIIAASGIGVPIALLNTFLSLWRRPGLPPAHYQVQPGRGWRGSRLGIRVLWLAASFRKRRKALVQWLRRVGCDRLSVLRHLARETGFDLERETDSTQWLIPFTYRRLPTLSLHALEFEFPHQPPKQTHYVGPLILEKRGDRSMTPSEWARLDRLLDRFSDNGDDSRLIYAGFGSVFSTDLDLVERLIASIAERPDWELLISLTERVGPADLGALPKQVHPFSWVPQVDVLRVADVAVTHGGINTLDECVMCGVPALVYCGGETDMAGSTARVAFHGIGIVGDRDHDGTAEICRHLDRLMHEPSFASNITRLREQYEAYQHNRIAEQTIESLLRRESDFTGAQRAPSDQP